MLLMPPALKELATAEQKPNKPIVQKGALDASSMFKRPDRIPKLGRRMFGNELVLVIDPPGPVEELSDFDLSLGIGASVGTGRKIQNQTSNPNTIIIAHDRAIAEADDSIQIESLGEPLARLFQILWDGRQNDD